MNKINKGFGLTFFTTLLAFSIFTSCSQIPSDIEFSVLEEVRNDTLSKVNVDIRINKKVDENVLKLIGNKLKNDLKINQYSKIWMFYYLPDMKVGSGAWATTHFTPDLEVKILGATEKQSNEIEVKSKEFIGEVIGKWKEEQYTSSVYIIYKKDDNLYLRTIFPNSQTSDESIEMKEEGDAVRYDYKTDGYNGEYFKVIDNELEFYNKENKMFTKGKAIE